MDLDQLRDEIRKRDLKIIELISERTELAKQIGATKIEQGLPIRNVEVEKKVIARYKEEGSRYGLSGTTMAKVASAVIQEAVDSESRLVKKEAGRKAAVIGGAGKMGAWTADLLGKCGHDVMIIDPAADNGHTIKECASMDIVVVSVPIHAVSGVLKELDGICGKDTLIFDLSSLKTPFMEQAREMAARKKVCSIHPMFGPSATSLYNRNLIICDCGNREAVDEAKALFDNKGGNIRIMDIGEHDGYMSYVLGITHAVNIALFTVLERSGFDFEDLQTVASTTFNKGLDTNRSVALEDPMLYYEIQHTNAHRDRMWDLFSEAVEDLKEASMSDDPEKFRRLMEAGRLYFDS